MFGPTLMMLVRGLLMLKLGTLVSRLICVENGFPEEEESRTGKETSCISERGKYLRKYEYQEGEEEVFHMMKGIHCFHSHSHEV